MDIDLYNEPLGKDSKGQPVFLKDIWPTPQEISAAVEKVKKEMYAKEYGHAFDGDDHWNSLQVAEGERSRGTASLPISRIPPTSRA